ncbi:hypothetical protein D3C72_2279150 [compost metagenome]
MRDDDDGVGRMSEKEVLRRRSTRQAFVVVFDDDGGKGNVRPLGNNGFQRLDDMFRPTKGRQDHD